MKSFLLAIVAVLLSLNVFGQTLKVDGVPFADVRGICMECSYDNDGKKYSRIVVTSNLPMSQLDVRGGLIVSQKNEVGRKLIEFLPNHGQKITFYAEQCQPLEVEVSEFVTGGTEYKMHIVCEKNGVPVELVVDDNTPTTESIVTTNDVDNDSDVDNASDQVFYDVDEMPVFPGGEIALRKYIAENLHYPEMAKQNNIQGSVYLRFVIDERGRVTNVEIMRGVDPLLDEEAVRVVKSLPNWKPGKQNGKAVKVSHSIPIKFDLPN